MVFRPRRRDRAPRAGCDALSPHSLTGPDPRRGRLQKAVKRKLHVAFRSCSGAGDSLGYEVHSDTAEGPPGGDHRVRHRQNLFDLLNAVEQTSTVDIQIRCFRLLTQAGLK